MKSNSRIRFGLSMVLILCTSIPFSAVFAIQSQSTTVKPSDSDAVVLEVKGEDSGMVPYWGEYLYFRLHWGGRVEYQMYEWSKTEYKKELVTYKFKIDEQETAKIIALLEDSQFQNARAVYPRLVTHTDSFYKQTISYIDQVHKKQVVVENYYGSNKQDPTYYPEPIIKLMSKIHDLKDKDIRIRTQ